MYLFVYRVQSFNGSSYIDIYTRLHNHNCRRLHVGLVYNVFICMGLKFRSVVYRYLNSFVYIAKMQQIVLLNWFHNLLEDKAIYISYPFKYCLWAEFWELMSVREHNQSRTTNKIVNHFAYIICRSLISHI